MRQTQPAATKTYPTDTPVDFVVIGSGPAGGSVARELTRKGFDVVVLEQGKAFGPEDMEHDEIGALMTSRWGNDPELQPQTWRKSPNDKAVKRAFVGYARAVGGTTFHFTGNYWRYDDPRIVNHVKKNPWIDSETKKKRDPHVKLRVMVCDLTGLF